MPVVVVESPSKARTIEKYLGKNYSVLATYGHIRDLYKKAGSVDPTQDFKMKWEIQPEAKKNIKAVIDKIKKDPELILATDQDREGEAIAWHLVEILQQNKALQLSDDIKRITFSSITKNSINHAMENPRLIDVNLVDAYLARRALDYLVGFSISPVLWRKFPIGTSAGRVQSVCLRLISEREDEITSFISKEYWSIEALLQKSNEPDGQQFQAQLTVLDGKKLIKYSLESKQSAKHAEGMISERNFKVKSVSTKLVSRRPYAPFTTATLQQDASYKLKFSAKRTMQLAQRLYEAGHITYMRTDAVNMASEAIADSRMVIKEKFGTKYLPEKSRFYKNKAKNAQEAHECIRPTSLKVLASNLVNLDINQKRLYELIWKRTLASQMMDAKIARTKVDIASDDARVELSATGSVTKFNGFLSVYEESTAEIYSDLSENKTRNQSLPKLVEGDAIKTIKLMAHEHHTQPPPRYNEASIVKEMVQLGIGRPSTYASIISTIQQRGYVELINRTFFPTLSGQLVTSFLIEYFRNYVDYEFTANLEEKLDNIARGKDKKNIVLNSFWKDFSTVLEEVEQPKKSQIYDKLTDNIALRFLPEPKDKSQIRSCPSCETGKLVLRLSKQKNPFFGCSNYPDCNYSMPLYRKLAELGINEESGLPIVIKYGSYGPFIEHGSKKTVIPGDISYKKLDLKTALQLLELPRDLGSHPEDNQGVIANIGPRGPYVNHGKSYAPVKDTQQLMSIDLSQALELLSKAKKSNGLIKDLGPNPDGGGDIHVMNGRYGPYLKFNEKNIKIPKGLDPATISTNSALEIIKTKGLKANFEERELGEHPDKGGVVSLKSGRYGPYIKWQKVNAKVPDGIYISEITLQSAVELIENKLQGKTNSNLMNVMKEIGEHPEGGNINIMTGRYGPYIKWKNLNVSLPGSIVIESISMEQAMELIQAKKQSKPRRKTTGRVRQTKTVT